MGPQAFHPPSFAAPSFVPRGGYPRKSKREQNADRQRAFRERNPGYYGRLHAKRKAELKAYCEQRRAAELLAAQESAEIAVPETIRQTPVVAEPLKQSIDPIKPMLSENPPTEPTQILPESDAMLLLMLVASLAKLRTQRAESLAWQM